MTKQIMIKAHKMTKEIKVEYPEVNYKTQLGLCMSYLLTKKEETEMINYETFGLDSNNLNKLKPLLLAELEGKSGMVTIKMVDLSGNDKSQTVTVDQARQGLQSEKMNDIVISSTKMRFEF